MASDDRHRRARIEETLPPRVRVAALRARIEAMLASLRREECMAALAEALSGWLP